MRPLTLTAIAALCLAAAACSPAERDKAGQDAKDTASNLKETVKQGTDSAPAAELKDNAKDLAKDAGVAIKKGAVEVKDTLNQTVEKQKVGKK